MAEMLNQRSSGSLRRVSIGAIAALFLLLTLPGISARQPSPSSLPRKTPQSVQVAPAPSAVTKNSSPDGALPPPSIPVDEIIQKFAAREEEFKIERDNFTYTQTFVIQTLDDSGQPDGEYSMTSEIVFTPAGKRFERIVSAPAPTLERISVDQQDLDDLEHVQPFVLTTSELPKYDIKYVDHERLDDLTTYVFSSRAQDH